MPKVLVMSLVLMTVFSMNVDANPNDNAQQDYKAVVGVKTLYDWILLLITPLKAGSDYVQVQFLIDLLVLVFMYSFMPRGQNVSLFTKVNCWMHVILMIPQLIVLDSVLVFFTLT